jgi:N-acyl amino acid synthase of PEP-CTERM/exosortase system
MSFLERFNLGYGFRRYFRIDAALDSVRRDDVYRIRHEVYCEDLKYEPERPDRREIDDYDAQSVHCLLTTANDPHRPVGCTRLVLTNPADPDAPLPFERTCADTLDRSIVDPAKLPRDRIAEVSRLAVRRIYRRRKGEEHHELVINDEDFESTTQPRFPYIPIGLYMGAISLAAHKNIDFLFVLTEPRLANHFARLGVDIRQIGDPVSHRGTRVPSVINVHSVIRDMRFMMKPLWRAVNENIESSIPRSSMLH